MGTVPISQMNGDSPHFSVEKYAQLLSNPLAGAVVLSLWGMALGFGTRLLLVDWIKRIFK